MARDTELVDFLRTVNMGLTRLTSDVAGLRGLVLNNVLRSELVILGSSGHAHRNFSTPFAAVSLWAYGSAITAWAGPLEGTTKREEGIGLIDVPAGQNISSWPLAGSELTIYGTAGDKVALAVFGKLSAPAPASGIGGDGPVIGGTP